MIDFDLRGRVALVTGGASGIGQAVVEAAAAQGMKVAIVDANAAAAEDACERLRQRGFRAESQCVDVRDRDALDSAVARFESELGPIYGAVMCAGISSRSAPESMSSDQWGSVIDINLTGTFNTVQAVGRGMLDRGEGSVVMIGSTNSLGGHTERASYVASKHGVHGLVRSIAIDWASRGVRVNAIAPGAVDTPLLRKNSEQVLKDTFFVRIPQGRPSRPAEQASVCMFLLSEAASYITGAMIPVDGALTAGYWNHHPVED